MRIVVFIFSVFMLSLALMPCADDMNKDGKAISEMSHDHEHDSGEDLCSPLCFCHCCHVHFQIPSFKNEWKVPSVNPQKQTTYRTSLLESPQRTLFKPPRV